MACPGTPQLEALLQARVTEQEEIALAAHLGGCVACQQRLEGLAGGLERIPHLAPIPKVTPVTSSPGLARVMGHLQRVSRSPDHRPAPHPPVPETALAAPIHPSQGQDRSGSHRPASHRESRKARWRRGLAGAGLCGFLGWIFLVVEPVSSPLRSLSYDVPFALRNPIQPQEVLIVSMDKDSRAVLNPGQTNQWSRSWHARLLKKALALGAELVVFDLTFARPTENPAADQEFANALHAAPQRVAIGVEAQIGEEGNVVHYAPQRPIPAFENIEWGIVEMLTDPDKRIRRHYVDPDVPDPGLAWKAAELWGKAPADRQQPRWLNYYGPRGTLRSIRYDHLLEQPASETNLLAGQVLLVGWNPAQPDRTGDEHSTPYTRWTGVTFSGVEIHATAFLNLVRNEWIETLPRGLESAIIIGLGMALGLAFSGLRPGWALAGGVAGFGLLLLAACLLFWIQRCWFPWLIVGWVQLPCAWLCSLVAHSQQLARRQAALAEALSRVATPPPTAAVPVAPRALRNDEPRRLPEIPDHVPLRCVGRGAYGEVWLARDVIGSFRAVKVVYRNTFTTDDPFEREFRGIQKFSPLSRLHPGWVDILHVGRNEVQGYFYYIMELGDDEQTGPQIDPERYVPKTLAGELRQRGRLPIEECLSLGVALADALEHLHHHGLIHRDIKPSNVIFVRGAPKFTDIGLVTDAGSPRKVSWLGTEGYMAPEGPGTPAADVFGLGKLIYEMATGRDRQSFPEPSTAMRDHGPMGAWQQFQPILQKACEEDPSQRYAHAADLSRDLLELRRSLTSAHESRQLGSHLDI